MVAGANPPRHRFMETPGGDHRIGADVVVVKDIMKAPTIDNILHWVEIKFLDSKDPPNEKQMRTYSDFLGSSTKLAMIQYLLIPKQVIVVVRQRQYRKIHKKPSSTPQGKKDQ